MTYRNEYMYDIDLGIIFSKIYVPNILIYYSKYYLFLLVS